MPSRRYSLCSELGVGVCQTGTTTRIALWKHKKNTSSANPYGGAERKGYTFFQIIISATFTALPTPSIFLFRCGPEVTYSTWVDQEHWLISYDPIRKRRERGRRKEEGGLQKIHSPSGKQYPIDRTRIADVVIRVDMLNEKWQAHWTSSGRYIIAVLC
jgi:hypothetical protein